MKLRRQYRMRSRAEATHATRDRVLEAMLRLFLERWYDEITLRDVAEEAGVALQTVLNHFASKEGLLAALLEDARLLDEFAGRRFQARPGDVRRAVELLVGDYEKAGDTMVRLLALESRTPAVRTAIDMGRIGHRLWLESIFEASLHGLAPAARERRLDLLVCATDVYTWQILRRDQGKSRDETFATMLALVRAVEPQASHNGRGEPS